LFIIFNLFGLISLFIFNIDLLSMLDNFTVLYSPADGGGPSGDPTNGSPTPGGPGPGPGGPGPEGGYIATNQASLNDNNEPDQRSNEKYNQGNYPINIPSANDPPTLPSKPQLIPKGDLNPQLAPPVTNKIFASKEHMSTFVKPVSMNQDPYPNTNILKKEPWAWPILPQFKIMPNGPGNPLPPLDSAPLGTFARVNLNLPSLYNLGDNAFVPTIPKAPIAAHHVLTPYSSLPPTPDLSNVTSNPTVNPVQGLVPNTASTINPNPNPNLDLDLDLEELAEKALANANKHKVNSDNIEEEPIAGPSKKRKFDGKDTDYNEGLSKKRKFDDKDPDYDASLRRSSRLRNKK
jgi:hypothetical protein